MVMFYFILGDGLKIYLYCKFTKKHTCFAGYSVSVGERNNVPLYFTGAPRYNHTGQVILFKHDGKNWTVAHRKNGNQVGNGLENVCVFICVIIHIAN